MTTETAPVHLGHRDKLPYFPSFSLCVPKQENIVNPNWAFNISRDDAPFVSPFLDSNSDLHNFPCQTRSTQNLDNG